MLVVAAADILDVRQMIETARSLNPNIETLVRTHSEEEALLLEQEQAGRIFLGESELASGMARHILERYGLAKA
jgi:CPA2 family monovalent cation:H+ antiporter-2